MLKNFLFFIALIFLISFNSNAQDASENQKVWTLEECINYARENSLQIRRAILTKELNQISYEQSKASLLPNVNAGAGTQYNFGNRRVGETDIVRSQNAQTVDFGVNAELNLFSGFATQNNIKSNKAYLEASLAEVHQTENTLSLNVASAYLDIIFNKELLNAAELQLKNTREQVARTEKLVKAGALPEVNLLEVKAQEATEELNVTNAENTLILAKLNLQQLLLLPSSENFEIYIPETIFVDSLSLNISAAELYNISLTTQPSIKSAEYFIKGSRYAELAAKGQRYPRITLSGGLSSNHYRLVDGSDSTYFNFTNFRRDVNDNFGQNVRLQLSIPIFNNWQVRSQIQNSIVERRRAELNSIETRNTLRLNVEQAYTNAKAANKRLNSTKNQVLALRESFRVNEQRFDLGAINSLDYTLAKNNLNRAESDLIRAKYDYLFRLKILDFYQNKPLTLTSSK